MKYNLLLLPLAARAATAFVLPDAALTEEILLAEGTIHQEPPHDSDGSAWWDELPSKDEVVSSVATTVKSSIDNALESISSVTDKVAGSFDAMFDAMLDEEDDMYELDEDLDPDGGHHGGHGRHGRHGRHGHHGHLGNATKTIYELVTESKYTTKFAKILEDYSEVADILKSTKANSTLFVPTDKAFERIPDHHKDKDHKPSKEFILAALKNHIAPGVWPARRLAFQHTVPSALEPESLGGDPQRLRVRASLLGGLYINFISKVVAADIVAKNGLVHAVDHIVFPPPPVGQILTALPGTFSTLTLGFETTGLGKELHDLPTRGGTLFAPTNRAFTKLGFAANAFLFSPRGKKYLTALLKYHVVANETFYSDAYYSGGAAEDGADGGADGLSADSAGRRHYDLPSLLDGKPISVDVRRWLRFISIRVNGWTRVVLQDAVAYDGVIQVIDSVLIPSHKHKGKQSIEIDEEEDEVSVEELVERLEPYVEGVEGVEEQVWGDL